MARKPLDGLMPRATRPESVLPEDYIALCDIWFPAGRNPWRDLFTTAVIGQLTKILRIDGDHLKGRIATQRLNTRLCLLAERYLVLQQESILQHPKRKAGITYGDRASWLTENVVKPARKLQTSLSYESLPWLHLFPFEQEHLPPHPAFPYLAGEIKALAEWAEELARLHRDISRTGSEGQRPALRPNVDIKYALAFDLTKLYAEIPQADSSAARVPAITSAPTDRPSKRSLAKKVSRPQRSKQDVSGAYIDFLRCAARPILGHHDNLTDQAKVAVKKFKSSKRI